MEVKLGRPIEISDFKPSSIDYLSNHIMCNLLWLKENRPIEFV